MNINRFRSKRVIIPAAALVVALGVGGALWGTAANADVSGGDRDRVGAAAVQAVGGGTVLDVETSDDPGEAWEAEVRKSDGTEVDVALDKDLKVVAQAADTDTPDAGDRALSDTERTSAEKAAVAAVAGTVTEVEASDDQGVAYEVSVRAADNTEWDVDLDSAFKVVAKTQDD